MRSLLILTATAVLANTAQGTVIDFDELNPADRPVYEAANPGFVSKDTTFNGGFYAGWTYSNDNDVSTPGYTNQYASYTGTDFSGTGNYGVAYLQTIIDLPTGSTPMSVRLTNTTYAALSMLLGDGYAKQFGGTSGDDPDYFDVTFTGHSEVGGGGTDTGSTTFRLADYTFADNAQDYIVDTWELLDLTPLGSASSISLSWDSTDVGSYGLNTPTYVAIDNLVLVPEPTSILALLLAVCSVGLCRQRVG